MRLSSSAVCQVATTLLSLSSLASAWPRWLPDRHALVARQDDQSSSTSSPTQSPTTSRPTNLNVGTQTPTRTGSSSGATGRGNSTVRPTFAAEDGAGSVVMITPAPTASQQLYKVGDLVTWAWNYTSLQGAPTAIDVSISCAAATRSYALTQNMTFATRVDFVWDSSQSEYKNMVVEEYTLLIHDADTQTAAASPGYLAPFSGLTFGVYTPQPYTPLASGWQCVSCSGAAPGIDRHAVGFALAMSTFAVMAFTWFATGLGVLAL